MTEIKLTKRYPQSRAEDITDAFMRGYEQGKKDGLKVGKQIVLGAFETYITADRKTENNSEKPNNCEKDCFLCKWLGDVDVCGRCRSRNLFAEADTEPTISKMEQVEGEPKICDTCRYYNSNIPCGSTPSACKKADKFAEEFVDGLKKLKTKGEPQKWETPPKFEHKGFTTTCVSVPAFAVEDEPQTCDHRCVQTEVGCERTDCQWK